MRPNAFDMAMQKPMTLLGMRRPVTSSNVRPAAPRPCNICSSVYQQMIGQPNEYSWTSSFQHGLLEMSQYEFKRDRLVTNQIWISLCPAK